MICNPKVVLPSFQTNHVAQTMSSQSTLNYEIWHEHEIEV